MRGIYARKEKSLSHSKLEENHVLHLLDPGVVISWSKILFQANTNLL